MNKTSAGISDPIKEKEEAAERRLERRRKVYAMETRVFDFVDNGGLVWVFGIIPAAMLAILGACFLIGLATLGMGFFQHDPGWEMLMLTGAGIITSFIIAVTALWKGCGVAYNAAKNAYIGDEP